MANVAKDQFTIFWTLFLTSCWPLLDTAITDVNDTLSIGFLAKVVMEDGDFRLSMAGTTDTSSKDHGDHTDVIDVIDRIRDLRPGYEQIVVDINCTRIMSIDTTLHLVIRRMSPLDTKHQEKVKHRLVKDLNIDARQLHVETIEEVGRISAIFKIKPSTRDEKASWLAPIKRMLGNSWRSAHDFFDDSRISHADDERSSSEDLRSVILEAFTSEYAYDVFKTTQLLHVDPCNSPLQVTGEVKSENSSTLQHHGVAKIISRNGSAEITYDVCAPPSAQFDMRMSLPMKRIHFGRSSSSVLTVITAAIFRKDTRPYQISCLSLSSRRTGHSVTKVGPYMVMFGGLAVLPSTKEAVPVSELWVIQQDEGDDSKGWLSLDRKHNIFIRPRARYGHVAAATSDGLFVIYGGHSGREYLHDVWAIRIGNNLIDDNPLQHDVTFPPFRWRQCYTSATYPQASLMAASVVDRSEQLFVFGGQQDRGGLSQKLWSLDLSRLTPTQAKWTLVWPFEQVVPSARFGHSLVWLPSRPVHAVLRAGSVVDFSQQADTGGMLLFGGVDMAYASVTLKNDIWFFDVALHTWIPLEAAEVDEPNTRMASAKRPPPLAFHVAASLGSAMVVVGGIASVVVSKVNTAGYDVCGDIWRWTDEDGWSLQFTSVSRGVGSLQFTSWPNGSSEAGANYRFKRVMGGVTQYWPEIGKLMIYGGQSDAKTWLAWHLAVTHMQQDRQTSQYVPVMHYYPPIFSTLKPESLKNEVLLLELEACISTHEHDDDASDALINPPSYNYTLQEVCLPCSVGAITSDGRRQEAQAPWLAKDAPQCTPCGAGTIYTGGQCRPCPPGFFGAFKGMDSWRMCWPCRADEFSAGNSSSRCKSCPKSNATIASRSLDGNEDRHSSEKPYIDTEEKEIAEQICPMFSESPDEVLEGQSVHEMNEPHGQNSQAQHLFWQEIAIQVWAAVVSCSILLLLLVQSRRPRSVALFMRQFDCRPITAAQVPSEAGGVILLCYVVTCLCITVVCFAHHLLNNSQLTSVSVPAQEISTRLGQIEVDLLVSATLVGYTGPCVDGDFEEGPWDLDIAAHSRRLQPPSGAHYDERPYRQFSFDVADDSIPISVKEEFSFDDEQHRIVKQRDLQVESEPAEMHPFLHRRARHPSPTIIDTGSFILVEKEIANKTRYEQSAQAWRDSDDEFVRKLKDEKAVPCHRLVSMTSGGIAWGKNVASTEPHTFCERLGNRQCRVSFSCRKCGLSKGSARVILDVSTGYTFTAAREIHWQVKTTWLQPRDSKGHTLKPAIKSYSSVETVVTSGGANSCLRGPKPSLVRMTMVPTAYQNLLLSSHIYGFVLQYIDAHRGSVASQMQFHENLAQLQSGVELHCSKSFLKLVLSKKHSAFDFLAQILGFLSGMSLIARVLLATWHSLDARFKDRSSCFWSNPLVRCLSSIMCCCISEESGVEEMTHRESQTMSCTRLPGKWSSVPEEYELVTQSPRSDK